MVAQRIEQYANLVGRERVIAGTDCGFATFASFHAVDPAIGWRKLEAMVQGAEIASRLNEKLFGKLKAPVTRIGGAFSAVPMANALEQAWIPNKDAIADAVRAAVNWKG